MVLNFSVITPSYNQGEFIERTILSVLNQTIPAMEYMVFDGGSKDQTVDILKKYESRLFWVSEKDGGQTNAVNKGLRRAKGDIIAWLNSDDVYYPETFKIVLDFFTENPLVDIIYGKANNIDKEDGIIDEYLIEPWNFERLKSHCFLSQPAVFFRRKVVERYGFLDESLSYCMDYEYWLRLAKEGASFAYLPKVLAGSRLYQETKTMDFRVPVHLEIIKMLRSKFKQVPDRWFSNYAHAASEIRNIDEKDRRSFLPFMISTTALTSLRWNKKISKSLRKTLKEWIGEYFKLVSSRPKVNKVEPDTSLLDIFPVQLEKKRIVVDLTRLQPGGENGGAKLMTIELIVHMSKMFPEYQFFLITPSRCNDELVYLDSSNIQRICIEEERSDSLLVSIRLNKKIFHSKTTRDLLHELNADLLFNPLTDPLFFNPTVPSVSVIYDLQYAYYPEFFSKEQYEHRDRHVKDACRLSNYVACISNYVRETVLEKVNVKPEKVTSIPIRLSERIAKISVKQVPKLLKRFSVSSNDFILYPANFWLHKNHARLFEAFSLYRSQSRVSQLKLVCTGTPNDYLKDLSQTVKDRNLENWVVFPGHVTTEEFSALMSACKAVIFPSLYEGFGMPLLEAMTFGKPVFCSQVTSLPEVAGDAAFFFDPKNVKDIAKAIEIIENDSMLLDQLVLRGSEHMKAIVGPQEMAAQYKQLFEKALTFEHSNNAVHNLHLDHWTKDYLVVTYENHLKKRKVEIDCFLPPFFPKETMQVAIYEKNGILLRTETLVREKNLKISQNLPNEAGYLTFKLSPAFQPKAYNMNEDTRLLGFICKSCRIISDDGSSLDLLSKEQ